MAVDRSKLTVQEVAMLDQHEAAQKQVTLFEKSLSTLEDIEKLIKGTDNAAKLVKPLADITTQLEDLNSKEAPKAPDHATPVVKAIEALREEVTASLQIKPAAPQVNVKAPNVMVEKPDFSKVEKIMKTDIPKAFQDAIDSIPEASETDLTPLVDQGKLMLDKLADIDIGVRMKSQPGSIKVTNPDGTPIAGGSGGTQYTDGTSTITHPIGTIPVYDKAGTITAVSVTNPLPVSATVSTTGLATDTKQDTGNASLSSLDTKTPALGQALAAGSTPVVLTASQLTTLTPPAAITGYATESTLATASAGYGAIGAIAPTSAVYLGARNSAGNLAAAMLAANSINTSGNQYLGASIIAQFDDVSPTAITENNFGSLRMSSNRNLYGTIRDAAGNERGANVNSSNQLSVSIDGSTVANIGRVSTTSAVVSVGQQTSGTSAVQLSSGSNVPTNGIIVQAISTNVASVFIGGSGVTTSTGFELQAGQAVSFTCNLNTLYVVGANGTDKVCWNVE